MPGEKEKSDVGGDSGAGGLEAGGREAGAAVERAARVALGNDEEGVSKVAFRGARARRRMPPELFCVVIECGGEAEQREWYERLVGAGMRVRLVVV